MPDRDPEVDLIIASVHDWRAGVAQRLRELVHEADPEIVEAAKWKRPTNPLGAPVFEHAGLVATIAVLKGRVRITLAEGARLPDPHGLFNAALDAGHMRGIDIGEGEEIDGPAIVDLVRAGVALNLAKAEARRSK